MVTAAVRRDGLFHVEHRSDQAGEVLPLLKLARQRQTAGWTWRNTHEDVGRARTLLRRRRAPWPGSAPPATLTLSRKTARMVLHLHQAAAHP